MRELEQRLIQLDAELEQVKTSKEEYLPAYGYSHRDEVIALIQEEISEVEDLLTPDESYYTDDELEEERHMICASQGLSRYC